MNDTIKMNEKVVKETYDKNYSIEHATIQGRGETVDKFEAMFINKNAE